jgi:transposase-like protein
MFITSNPCNIRHAVSKEKKPIPGFVSRLIKRFTKPGMGFFSDLTAWRTWQGFEVMNMIRKGQVRGVAKGDVRGQVALVARLFGVVA